MRQTPKGGVVRVFPDAVAVSRLVYIDMIAVLQPEPLFCVHIKDVYAAGAQMPAHIPKNAQHILRRQNMVHNVQRALLRRQIPVPFQSRRRPPPGNAPAKALPPPLFPAPHSPCFHLHPARIRHIRPCGARSRAARCRSRHPAPGPPPARRLPAAGAHSPHAVFADTQAQKSVVIPRQRRISSHFYASVRSSTVL